MTPDYTKRLLELSSELKELADDWINLGDGSDSRSQQHTDQEILLHSKISHLAGYLDALQSKKNV